MAETVALRRKIIARDREPTQQQLDILPRCIELLRRHSPESVFIYERTRKRHHFACWLAPEGVALGIPIAIHESTHMLNRDLWTAESAAIAIDRHRTIFTPHLQTFSCKELYVYLPRRQSDAYYEAYLLGSLGDQGIGMILEELNAYTQGCRCSTALVDFIPATLRCGERDGLASFMLYLLLYLRHAANHRPHTWQALRSSPAHIDAIRALFSRADDTMGRALEHPRLGIDDAPKRALVNQNRRWLVEFLGNHEV